jgi:hypothetical protein
VDILYFNAELFIIILFFKQCIFVILNPSSMHSSYTEYAPIITELTFTLSCLSIQRVSRTTTSKTNTVIWAYGVVTALTWQAIMFVHLTLIDVWGKSTSNYIKINKQIGITVIMTIMNNI